MDTGKFVGLLVFGIIGALLVVALTPMITDVTDPNKTYENEGYFNLEKYTDELTFSWDYTDPDVFTVNDEEVEYHNDSGMNVSVVLGERFAIRLTPNNAGISFYGAGTYISANATTPVITATLSEGSITVTNGTNSKVITNVTEVYSIANDGSYVMKKADSTAYLNSGSEIVADSEIYATGQTFNGSNYIFWHMDGTIDDLKYPDEYDSGLTITNEAIHGQYSTVCNDLYELNNITFTATASNSVVYNVTASYFVVPAEVTAEKTVHADSTLATVLNLLPLIVVIGLFMFLVGEFLYTRYL